MKRDLFKMGSATFPPALPVTEHGLTRKHYCSHFTSERGNIAYMPLRFTRNKWFTFHMKTEQKYDFFGTISVAKAQIFKREL